MAPDGSESADPRAYRRLAAMIRQEISEGRLGRGSRRRQSLALAASTGTHG